MKVFIAICLLVSLPMFMALNCYVCSPLSGGGCNDPFNATGSGVTQTGLLTTINYCEKLVAVGIATRSGVASCTATGFYLNSGTACCQTDLCNGAHISYQMPIMLIVSLVIILAKLQ